MSMTSDMHFFFFLFLSFEILLKMISFLISFFLVTVYFMFYFIPFFSFIAHFDDYNLFVIILNYLVVKKQFLSVLFVFSKVDLTDKILSIFFFTKSVSASFEDEEKVLLSFKPLLIFWDILSSVK